MPTLAPLSLTSVISRADEKMTPAQMGYLEALAQDRAHDLVRTLFMKESDADDKITRAFLSRKLGKKPEQITRWLAVPGNWTLGTFADLLGAMGFAPTFGAVPLHSVAPSNRYHPMLGKTVPQIQKGHARSVEQETAIAVFTENFSQKSFKDMKFTSVSST